MSDRQANGWPIKSESLETGGQLVTCPSLGFFHSSAGRGNRGAIRDRLAAEGSRSGSYVFRKSGNNEGGARMVTSLLLGGKQEIATRAHF